jgi:Trk K+ transport system NAD-binding subunit
VVVIGAGKIGSTIADLLGRHRRLPRDRDRRPLATQLAALETGRRFRGAGSTSPMLAPSSTPS